MTHSDNDSIIFWVIRHKIHPEDLIHYRRESQLTIKQLKQDLRDKLSLHDKGLVYCPNLEPTVQFLFEVQSKKKNDVTLRLITLDDTVKNELSC